MIWGERREMEEDSDMGGEEGDGGRETAIWGRGGRWRKTAIWGARREMEETG